MLKQRGFALVAALMMMILMVIIAVALLSLSSISLRSSGIDNSAKIAKSNARLALYMALADMQKHLGPDKSVTADASLLGENVPRPSMVGVWNSYEDNIVNDPSQAAPNYSQMKGDTNFKGWLVSKPISETANESVDYGSSDAGSDSVKLFFENEDGRDMRADVVRVQGNHNNRGAYAWAVSQAATKASINSGGEFEDRYVNAPLQAPDRANLELSGIAKQPEDGWDTRQSKVLSVKQAVLDPAYNLNKAGAAELALEHTAQSRGVLANVSKGGLKTDLSLGFEMERNDFLRANWNGSENPFFDDNSPGSEMRLYDRAASAETVNMRIPYGPINYDMRMDVGAPPTFSSLRSHYRLYKHLYNSGATPTARQRFQTNAAYATEHPRGSETSVNPVLDRVAFFLSITLESGVPALLISPVVTLWNPYNVAIESDGYVVYPWMDIPLHLEVKTKPAASPGDGTTPPNGSGHLSRFLGRGYGEGWNDNNHGRQAEPYFYCKITNSGTANITTPIRLEPGEVKTFVPATPQPGAATSSGAVVKYERLTDDMHPSRSVFLKPMDSNGISPTAGLRMSIRQLANGSQMTETLTDDSKAIRFILTFNPNVYHYFVNLEDARRIRDVKNYVPSNNFSRITEVQNMQYQGKEERITSNFFTRSSLPKVVGVLETYHRVARSGGSTNPVDGSDIAYTVNPRHRHTNYTISGSANMPNSHYGTTLQSISTVDTHLQTNPATFRAFYGAANDSENGREILTFFDVPSQPMMSLGSFQSADLANTAFSTSSPFGNSWASPYVPIGRAVKTLSSGSSAGANGSFSRPLKIYDQSYLLNAALWDGFYFSSIAPETGLGASTNNPYQNDSGIATQRKSIANVVRDWISDPVGKPLRNTRHILYKGGISDEDLESKLLEPEGAREAAAHILVDGSFNVNSTNVKAWAAVLASLRGQNLQANYGSGSAHNPGNNTPVVRLTEPMGSADDNWNGFRELSDSDIEKLAESIVEEVRERGPFQSLAEFVNRRMESGDMGRRGALQAAIEKAQLNSGAGVESWTSGRGYPEENNISTKDTGVAIPGWITQADILTPLAPFISVRSDTFTIRAYGDARDASGNVVARAYCEAVVQRVPNFVDPIDKAIAPIQDLSEINATFGRKFEIVSIREIAQKETDI